MSMNQKGETGRFARAPSLIKNGIGGQKFPMFHLGRGDIANLAGIPYTLWNTFTETASGGYTMAPFEIGRPVAGEYDPYFDGYVARVTETDILAALASQKEELIGLISGVGEEKGGYRYAEGKWSIRQVIGHVIDAERVFGYRAVCIARGDQTPLPSFDEGPYAAAAGSDGVPLAELLGEFRSLRESHELMFKHFPREAWTRRGNSAGSPTTPRAIAFIITGHARHHAAVLAERYLKTR
jgi:hypothetical protein